MRGESQRRGDRGAGLVHRDVGLHVEARLGVAHEVTHDGGRRDARPRDRPALQLERDDRARRALLGPEEHHVARCRQIAGRR